MNTTKKSIIELDWITYEVQVIDGIRYCNWMTNDEFVDYLFENNKFSAIKELCFIGNAVIKNNPNSKEAKEINKLWSELINDIKKLWKE